MGYMRVFDGYGGSEAGNGMGQVLLVNLGFGKGEDCIYIVRRK